MFDIEKQHHDNVADLHRIARLALDSVDGIEKQIEIGFIVQEIEKAIDKAKLYDLMQLKRSQGGKKSASNMTAEERKARALKASHARKAKKSTAGDAGNKTTGQNTTKILKDVKRASNLYIGGCHRI